MKVLTFIFSYNTPARTIRCYNELLLRKPDWHKIIILDNSKKELVPQTPDTVWLGEENRGHGGMIDHVLHAVMATTGYDLIGMINNDTYDYAPRFIERLVEHWSSDVGIISPSIKPGGSVWPTMLTNPGHARETNFVETIAPWYGKRLFNRLIDLCPMEYFGYIDRAVSILSKQLGLRNVIVDELAITHEAGIGRKETGTYDDFNARARESISEWYRKTPLLSGLENVWPDEINSTDWKLKKGSDEGSACPDPTVHTGNDS